MKQLPSHIQKQVKRAFECLAQNPQYPSLHFKRVNQQYSIRINRQYRALGDIQEDEIVWDWVGPHDEYERRIRQTLISTEDRTSLLAIWTKEEETNAVCSHTAFDTFFAFAISNNTSTFERWSCIS